MDINERMNMRIINEVKKHDSLYNVQSKWYKNVPYREILWTKIGKCLGIPGKFQRKRTFCYKNV